MALEPSDVDLVCSIRAADAQSSQAESALCRRYAPRVALYGRKHLKSQVEAEDLAQQVMLRVLEAIRQGRVDDPSRLSSFVFGTCRHVSWDMRRRDQRQRKLEREAEHLVSPTPEASGSDVLRLFRCLGELPEREAAVLRMTFMEDRESDDIAGRLGVTAGNVRVIRYRALAKMAGCMGEEARP